MRVIAGHLVTNTLEFCPRAALLTVKPLEKLANKTTFM